VKLPHAPAYEDPVRTNACEFHSLLNDVASYFGKIADRAEGDKRTAAILHKLQSTEGHDVLSNLAIGGLFHKEKALGGP
jgi:hypothetical protein